MLSFWRHGSTRTGQRLACLAVVFLLAVSLLAPGLQPIVHAEGSAGPASTESPGVLQFSADSYTVSRNDQNTLYLTVTRTNGSKGTVAVDYRFEDGTAKGSGGSYGWGDYTNYDSTRTLIFAEGEVRKTIRVSINFHDDNLEEEYFTVWLDNPTGGATIGAVHSNKVTIKSPPIDPIKFRCTFTSDDYAFYEGEDEYITVTVECRGSEYESTYLRYRTTDGTAVSGSDYTAQTFNVGTDWRYAPTEIKIPIREDKEIEDDEYFTLTLSDPYPAGKTAAGAIASARVTIIDDDASEETEGELQFSEANFSVSEEDYYDYSSPLCDEYYCYGLNYAEIKVIRENGARGIVKVKYQIANGSASDNDFENHQHGELTFLRGETEKIIRVKITDDYLFEGDEDFTVTLSDPTGGATLGGQTSTRVTIVDDESGITLPERISLNKTELLLRPGGYGDLLRATVSPLNYTPGLVWKSSNPAVATVSDDGLVTPHSSGKATITVASEHGGPTAECSVKVANQGKLTHLDMVESQIGMMPHEVIPLYIMAVYENGERKNIAKDPRTKYTISNPAAISIINGKVWSAHGGGEATVTVVYDGKYKTTFTVSSSLVSAVNLTPSVKQVTMPSGFSRTYVDLVATFSDGTKRSVTQQATWQTNSQDLVTVNGGTLTSGAPRFKGTTAVTAVYHGIVVYIPVHVT
ncbi:Ig-like domain-containing protein [Paenibacillus oenotherae]|uniref:Ig-like domain-containing protein n=1 Tax=Paenibacillus oenotherae TaxID=1435645 RepID=A0ABS7D5P4_9BACL|nr:Calx-beta domain-containing protein [Paenibacillus oenotherae]MBW7475151.1 Ig-like domain-containing protein [Paenibacillus oenotherae]